jgi:RNA polymerase sigma-70 factor (ECF subfamily)
MVEKRDSGVADETLVTRIQTDPGSPLAAAAATELFERYRERVYLWCVRRVRDHELALDLSQDVLVSAYRSVGTFHGRCKYSTWLFTIVHHRCLRAMRRPRLLWDDAVDLDALPSPRVGPEIDLEEQEGEEAILELMRTVLEPDEQLALWLRCFEKLPVDEITRRLGVSLATGARGVLQNARRKLRAALEQRRSAEP